MAGLAVIWEGGQVFPKAPSLGRSVQCSLMGENKGHIPAWGLIQVILPLIVLPLMVLPLLNTVRDSLESIFRVFRFSAAHETCVRRIPCSKPGVSWACLGCFMFTPASFLEANSTEKAQWEGGMENQA